MAQREYGTVFGSEWVPLAFWSQVRGYRGSGCKRDKDSTGCRAWFAYVAHLRCVCVQGVHGKGVDQSFPFDIAASEYREVVQTAIGIR